MLTEAQKKELRAALERERERLLKNGERELESSLAREREGVGDSIDEAVQEADYSTALRLRDREKWLLAKVNGAIERLDAGTIDECEECGGAIAFKRLLVRPVTTMCIDCKEASEVVETMSEKPGAGFAGFAPGESFGTQAEE